MSPRGSGECKQWQLRMYPDRIEWSIVSADCILCEIPLICITVIAVSPHGH